MTQFIVYACPVGELADQLARYFEAARELCGANTAHQYMPHCTLTGFFEERTDAAPIYTQCLARSCKRLARSRPEPVIEVKELALRHDWHGLELSSPWLQQVMVDFACSATSPTRKTPLRLKDWLHLSLAYDFGPEQAADLAAIAQTHVDPAATVQWELRFYQRNPDQSWICHQRWPLQETG